MMERTIYASCPVCWAPGMQTEEDWKNFAQGKKDIERTSEAPKLEFTTPLFRRRLGQLCRMTVQVVHDSIERFGLKDLPILFTSVYGEINREFTIDRSVITEGSVMPAAFSLSTFNAPIALATLQCGIKSGYEVVFPSKGNFSYALQAAEASVFGGKNDRILFVYGDELFPKEYDSIKSVKEGNIHIPNIPLAFALVIGNSPLENCSGAKFNSADFTSKSTPIDFLKMLLNANR
ncbi:MAG: beta-ketoacyl synthase chain length factor [Treponema sp.]|nr:beta-ketoacyl synthase chain length factor [Treponema sp.]